MPVIIRTRTMVIMIIAITVYECHDPMRSITLLAAVLSAHAIGFAVFRI